MVLFHYFEVANLALPGEVRRPNPVRSHKTQPADRAEWAESEGFAFVAALALGLRAFHPCCPPLPGKAAFTKRGQEAGWEREG